MRVSFKRFTPAEAIFVQFNLIEATPPHTVVEPLGILDFVIEFPIGIRRTYRAAIIEPSQEETPCPDSWTSRR
jgi:hypothetical protein